MDPDRLCSFFNRLQVILELPPRSALSEMALAVRALEPSWGGAPFVVVRDGVAAVVLRLERLRTTDRYSILKAVFTAHNAARLVAALEGYLANDAKPLDSRVQATLQHIQAGYNSRRRCCLRYLAKRVTLSPWYLSRLVRKHTGRHLADHVRRTRVEKASALIVSHPDRHLRHVARAVGFKDDSDLCHAFKLVTGCSPKEYLRLSQSTGIRS